MALLRTQGGLPAALGATVEAEVARGRPLSEALALFPDEVPAEDVALVEAGETTGNLDRTLDRLAERHEARRSLRRRFLTETAYPLILFHLAALLVPLPAAVAKDGRLLGPSWFASVLWILVPFYALLCTAIWLRRKARGRMLIRGFVDVLPGFGNAARHRRRADFADVLGAAYDAGVQMDRAVGLAGAAIAEPRVEAASQLVARGSTLRDALATANLLPPSLLSRLAIGEQAGEIGKVLGQVAREEAEAAEHVLRRATLVLSKAIYLGVALWIAFYYVSTMLGLYAPLLR